MNKSKNNKMLIAIVCVLIFIVVPVATVVGLVISNNDESVRDEKGIIAQYDKDENSLAQLSLKAVEVMKVGDAAKADTIEIITSAMKGKYGDSGATAQFLWSADSPIPVDISIRKEVARIIDGGRSNFEQSQNVRIDACRAYMTKLDYIVGGSIKRLLGFPKIDTKKYCTIVSSSHARKSFDTKIDSGLF